MRYIVILLMAFWMKASPHAIEWPNPIPEVTAVDEYQWELRQDQAEVRRTVSQLAGVLEVLAFEPITRKHALEIARAIYRDNAATGLGYEFYLGLLRVENPWLDHTIENWYGAVGLTQVVARFHDGTYPECGNLREEVYAQICYGSRIYLRMYDLYGDHTLALWAYNGCREALRAIHHECINYPRNVQTWGRKYASSLD